MWPFSRKSKDPAPAASVSVRQAVEQLATLGIRRRSGISDDDLLLSLGGTMDSPVDWAGLLCVLGGEVERGKFQRISDDLWHLDAECIEDNGDYVRVLERFVILAKGQLPLTALRDHVDIENGEAWVEFTLDGQPVHWDLEVDNDWLAPELYTRLQQLVESHAGGKKFFIVALGQDSLVCFGDDAMKEALSKLSGLKFEWE
jgi:hypothetical protein